MLNAKIGFNNLCKQAITSSKKLKLMLKHHKKCQIKKPQTSYSQELNKKANTLLNFSFCKPKKRIFEHQTL